MFALFCCCTFLLICSTNIHQFFLYFFLFPSDSEESDDDLTIGRTTCLLDKEDLDKSILFMLEQENQLRVKKKKKRRRKPSACPCPRTVVALARGSLARRRPWIALARRCPHPREEKDRGDKLSISQSRVALNLANFCYRKDLERIFIKVALCLVLCSAEVVDSHLSAVRRDHEKISQIEERRIRDDAALEEAKKKAVLEEKLHQEKAKAEAEAEVSLFQGLQFRYLPPGTGGTYWSARLSAKLRATKLAEEAERAALEAAQRAAEEAAESKAAASEDAKKKSMDHDEEERKERGSFSKVPKEVQLTTGNQIFHYLFIESSLRFAILVCTIVPINSWY
ncbi:hypothetical protein GW17_00008001, partial [Ensete ventricosum]